MNEVYKRYWTKEEANPVYYGAGMVTPEMLSEMECIAYTLSNTP